MIDAIIIIIFLFIATSLHLFGCTIAFLLMGIKVNEIKLFMGKTILKINWKIATVSIGWLPTGGNVSYDVEQFQRKNLFTRLFIDISGPLFVMISAVVFIKFSLASTNFFNGFNQIIAGALSPFHNGSNLVSNYITLLDRQNYIVAYGILATKITSFNMLPIPSLNGGHILFDIFSPIINEKVKLILMNIGFVFLLLFSISWSIAVIYSFF
ncbi:MAG: site-2 protease family protein [Legionella sp.]|uniref:site-2 protease family protein n=1 Tax=Legionella sp. TaxID=459 RepID=UPI00284D7932|nr:site-2 protease family protein [Legionella sp.]